METQIVDFLSNLKFGEAQEFEKMSVIPVFYDADNRINYITLKEAMESEFLKITEVDDSGSVPELKVINDAETPVLLLDGEELIGAKQNRIVNTSILLKEKSETIIPVSCVEQGRWAYESKNFADSDNIASYNVRTKKSASVKRSMENSGHYSSNQDEVWDEVHKLQNIMEVYSPTGALNDVYEAKSNDLDGYLNAFKRRDSQNGLIVFINGEIMGFDIVSSKSAYRDLHQKLIKSYSLDALVNENKKIKLDDILDKAKKFIKDIQQCNEGKHKSVGYGFDYRFASDSFIGSALLYQDVIHASFFKSFEIDRGDMGEMMRFNQRVNLRI